MLPSRNILTPCSTSPSFAKASDGQVGVPIFENNGSDVVQGLQQNSHEIANFPTCYSPLVDRRKPDGGFFQRQPTEGEKPAEGNKELDDLIGRNVEIRARFRRHSDKGDPLDVSSGSGLSSRGRERVRELARGIGIQEDGLFVRSSPIGRAVETGNIILEDAQARGLVGHEGEEPHQKRQVRIRHELGQVSPEFLKMWDTITSENLPKNLNDLEEQGRQETIYRANNTAMDSWFQMGDSLPEGVPSSRTVAATLAVLVSRVIDTPDKLWNDSALDEELISHNGVLEPLLREILLRQVDGKEVRGFNSIDEIGGGMQYAEAWELIVKTNGQRNKTVKIKLREQEYDIDLDRLKKLREEGIEINHLRRSQST